MTSCTNTFEKIIKLTHLVFFFFNEHSFNYLLINFTIENDLSRLN